MNDRILITGSGVISAIGNGKKETLDALLTNRSGIGRMEYVGSDLTRLPVGEVKMSDDELKSMLSVGDDSPVVRTTLLGIAALREALADAGIGDTRDVAFISGTTVGGMDRTERFYSDALEGKGPADLLATHDCGSCTADIAARCGGFAFVTTPSTACSSAMNAIILGCRLIRSGIYDIVVAGGAECLTRYHLDGFHSLMILDENPCRPFDKDRAGLNLGEGAAYVVLESESSARRRGVAASAFVAGYGNACDAFHQTASSEDGEGAFLAMSGALRMSGLSADLIQYVNAHGTATPDNDAAESRALRRVFGKNIPFVSSTKAFTGHTTSASGSIETVICMLAMENGFVPANLNWHTPMDDGILPVAVSEKCQLTNVMCNAFGFGGNDSSIILSAL